MISRKSIAAIDTGDEVVTAPVAAALKGVHRNSVHKAIKAGRLRAERSGKSWLIRRRDLDAWQVVGHRPRSSKEGRSLTEPQAPPGLSTERHERARRLKQLLAQWAADESGHDEEMWPKLKAVLENDRISSRKLFRDTPP